MLTYIYECKNCGRIKEVQQSIKDRPITHCTECDYETLERVIQTPEFFDRTPRTVGTLAEQRTRKHKGHVNEIDAKKKEERDKKEPWYGKLPNNKRDILNDPKKLEKYIHEGK